MTVYIDGSTGEGGGQVVRTSLALAAVRGERLVIENVRANRDEPGLKAQHLAAVRSLAVLTDATVEGDEHGSESVVFEPDSPRGGEYDVEVGTAGATMLVAHAVLPAALRADGDVRFRIRGGTHVRWSPTFEHFERVFLPLLRDAGAEASVELVMRGHYPQGGGEIVLDVSPSSSSLSPVEPRRAELEHVEGVSHVCGLPEHIVERQAESAREELAELDVPVEIDEVHVEEDAPSKGTAVTLVAYAGTRLGGSALGERGKPAEEVGAEAGEELISAVESGADVDEYTADQLVPYVALAGGSYDAPRVTSHLKTNVEITSKFADVSLDGTRVSSSGEGVTQDS
ncbi:MAG: RNA 3'-terminal phosphate cyclase [Halobacteriales archaeon]|nr:RNA 3'-terminal phosphate cyclase [Halobacteriales archaeon]